MDALKISKQIESTRRVQTSAELA